jgi:DNA-binding MarR family transcriptional regulator
MKPAILPPEWTNHMNDQPPSLDERVPPSAHPWSTSPDAIEHEAAALVAVWGLSRRAVLAEVSAMQLQALLIIERQETTNLGSLATALNALPSSTSRLCDRLEATGWIRRATLRTDARELTLALTPSGRALLTALRERRRADLARVLQEMPPAARTALLYGLREFATAADHTVEDRGTGLDDDWPALAARLLA